MSGQETRDALIAAAEREMALHGIYGASLKAIQEAAGQRNRSAVNHYFGDRNGLVQAIGIKHRAEIAPTRHAQLDRLERRRSITVELLAAAIVEPAATRLTTQSGRFYLIVLAEAVMRHGAELLFDAIEVPHYDSSRRLNNLLVDTLTGPPAARRLRVGEATLTATVLLADIARRLENGAITDRQATIRVRSTVAAISAMLRRAAP